METKAIISHCEVVDLQSKVVVASIKNFKRANTKADKLNLEYGAHRFSVKVIWADAV